MIAMQAMKRYSRIIAVMFALTIAVMFALFVRAYNEAVSLVLEQSKDEQMLLAEQTAVDIEENLQFLIREIELLSQNSALKDPDSEKALAVFEKTFSFVRKLHVNDIALIDRNGICRLPLMAPHLHGMDFSYRKYFKRAGTLEGSTPTLELVSFKGVDIGKKGIVLAMPLFNGNGEFDGVVVFTIKVNDLIDGFAPTQSQDRKCWVLDSKGEICYHPEYEPGIVLGAIPNIDDSFAAYLKKTEAGEPHAGEYLSPNGVETIAAAYPIKIAGESWPLVIATPKKTVTRVLGTFSADYLLATSVTLVAILCVSLGIALCTRRWSFEPSAFETVAGGGGLTKGTAHDPAGAVKEVLWEVDAEGAFTFVNPRMEHALRGKLGKSLFDSVSEDEAVNLKTLLHEMARSITRDEELVLIGGVRTSKTKTSNRADSGESSSKD
jgi:hypothetical protein